MSFNLENLSNLNEKELWFLCYLCNPNDYEEFSPEIVKLMGPRDKANPAIKCYIYKKHELANKIWNQNGALINKMIYL